MHTHQTFFLEMPESRAHGNGSNRRGSNEGQDLWHGRSWQGPVDVVPGKQNCWRKKDEEGRRGGGRWGGRCHPFSTRFSIMWPSPNAHHCRGLRAIATWGPVGCVWTALRDTERAGGRRRSTPKIRQTTNTTSLGCEATARAPGVTMDRTQWAGRDGAGAHGRRHSPRNRRTRDRVVSQGPAVGDRGGYATRGYEDWTRWRGPSHVTPTQTLAHSLGGRAFNFGGEGGGDRALWLVPPPKKKTKKGSIDDPPQILLRLTPGPWRRLGPKIRQRMKM